MKSLLNIRIQIVLLFIASLIYSYCIGKFDVFFDHVATISYVLFLSIYCLFSIFYNNDEENYLKHVLISTIALHIGLIVGYVFSGAGNELLWMEDSILEHVPKSLEIKIFLQSFSFDGADTRMPGYYRTSHFLTGLLFLIKASPVMSALSMMIFKLGCTFIIFKMAVKMFDVKSAFAASLLYTLSPSIIFYSFTFYKDTAVQFWYVFFIYFSYRAIKEHKYLFIPLAIISFMALGMERNYMAISLLPSIVLYLIMTKSINKYFKLTIFLLTLVATYFIRVKFLQFVSLDNVVTVFVKYRAWYNHYPDIDPMYNSQLPYILAWIKLYFTPIISPPKFTLFYDYSILLTWGSFVHQVTMLCFTVGVYKKLLSEWKMTVFHILPFFIFMCAFAYISSYSGRVRNSYYPIIAIFGGVALAQYIVPWLQAKLLTFKSKNP